MISCSQCGNYLDTDTLYIGKKIQCRKCGCMTKVTTLPSKPTQPPPKMSTQKTNSDSKSPNMEFPVLNVGGIIIIISSICALISTFIPWVDIGIASQNGFSQGTFPLLGCFAYPVIMIIYNRPISWLWGSLCGLIPIPILIWYIYSKSEHLEFMDKTVNCSGNGPIVFMISSIALVVGVLLHKPKSKI